MLYVLAKNKEMYYRFVFGTVTEQRAKYPDPEENLCLIDDDLMCFQGLMSTPFGIHIMLLPGHQEHENWTIIRKNFEDFIGNLIDPNIVKFYSLTGVGSTGVPI